MKKTCQGHDSQVYNTKYRKDGYNYPPLHPNCRSVTRPYFGEEAEQFLVRKARNPITGKTEIIDNMSYKEWLQKQREKYGNDAVDNSFKMVKNKSSDLKQYERYKNILNTDDTKTFEKFQELKYNNTDKWEKEKSDYKILTNSKYKEYASNNIITDEEYNTIYGKENGYIGNSNSFTINNILREKGVDSLNKNQKETFNALSNVISKNKVNDNILAVRRVNLKYIKDTFDFDLNDALNNDTLIKGMSNYIGTTVTEKGFMSASLTMDKIIDGNVELNLYIPKGKNAFITKNYEESEIILNHDTKYIITGVNEIINEYNEPTLVLDVEIL